MEDNIIGFHHFSIKAQRFQQTVDFYGTLGFKEVHSWSLPEFHLEQCTMLYHPRLNTYIEICDKKAHFPTQGRRRKEGEDFVENAIMHLCFVVKDAQRAYETALGNGAKPLSERTSLQLNSPVKSVSVANSLVYSPNGEVIEFLEAVEF
ncbi:VOC family protein [Rapidithrix thailandica]|uniref:VOC family protein n=1 Tax=Rapidithrix thailandica TaxID=413964 RepID=A0AAW9SLE9_9BACT